MDKNFYASIKVLTLIKGATGLAGGGDVRRAKKVNFPR